MDTVTQVMCGLCHCPQDADGGDSLQTWTVTANKLNEQPWTVTRNM